MLWFYFCSPSLHTVTSVHFFFLFISEFLIYSLLSNRFLRLRCGIVNYVVVSVCGLSQHVTSSLSVLCGWGIDCLVTHFPAHIVWTDFYMNWNQYTEITKSRNAFWLGTLALIIRSRAQSFRLPNEVAANNKCVMYGRLDEKTFLIDDFRISVLITRRPYLHHEDCSRKALNITKASFEMWVMWALQLLYSGKGSTYSLSGDEGLSMKVEWNVGAERNKKKTRINLSQYPRHILNYIRFLLLYLYLMFLLKKIEAEI